MGKAKTRRGLITLRVTLPILVVLGVVLPFKPLILHIFALVPFTAV